MRRHSPSYSSWLCGCQCAPCCFQAKERANRDRMRRVAMATVRPEIPASVDARNVIRDPDTPREATGA